MESSSEDSFAWTDTSSDSVDSPSMAADVVSKRSTEAYNKKEKKRKAIELSNSHCNGHEDVESKQVKLEIEQSESNNTYSMKKPKVKLEPESDIDIPKKKKKSKHQEINGNENVSHDSGSYDESYLNLRVKQEEISAPSPVVKHKKKRKHSVASNDNVNISEKIEQVDQNSNTYEESFSQSTQHESSNNKAKKKKKKSRKRSDSESTDKMDIDETLDIKEINFKQEHHSKKSGNTLTDLSLTENNTFQDESGCDELSAIQCDDEHNVHALSILSNKNIDKNNDSLYKSTIMNQHKKGNNNHDSDSTTKNKMPRISDRIRFEDEDNSEEVSSHFYETVHEKTSSKLRKFIKTISGMNLVSSHQLQQNSILTSDDEIWIVKCPKEIDIQAFCNIDLNIHGKTKIKVGGQTYDGSIEEDQGVTTATLSMGQSHYEIENLPLCGIISLRKRIPKAHFCDDNIMLNNQTNFIPLPETKCRHPLFGSNYKKALKIPSAIAERLNSINTEQCASIEKKKKKKHKKDRNPTDYEEIDAKCNSSKLKSEPASDTTEKKRKKRKHADDDDPIPKKVKKIKHDPESAEAWESEKAIEENLFNF